MESVFGPPAQQPREPDLFHLGRLHTRAEGVDALPTCAGHRPGRRPHGQRAGAGCHP